MHRIDDVIVKGGQIVLSHLPFADGQHVRVLVDANDAATPERKSIAEVRAALKGGVAHFDHPFEPMVPSDAWEMLK